MKKIFLVLLLLGSFAPAKANYSHRLGYFDLSWLNVHVEGGDVKGYYDNGQALDNLSYERSGYSFGIRQYTPKGEKYDNDLYIVHPYVAFGKKELQIPGHSQRVHRRCDQYHYCKDEVKELDHIVLDSTSYIGLGIGVGILTNSNGFFKSYIGLDLSYDFGTYVAPLGVGAKYSLGLSLTGKTTLYLSIGWKFFNQSRWYSSDNYRVIKTKSGSGLTIGVSVEAL